MRTVIGAAIGAIFGNPYIGLGSSSGFSPLSLFASGEEGAWYDPSDFSTMFQESTGVTPVTAVGQSVGLILDKSKGLVLGPELVLNGDFSSGATGWLASGGNTVTFTGGACRVVGDANSGPWQEISTVAGKTYKVAFDALVTSGTFNAAAYEGGGFTIQLASIGGNSNLRSFIFIATTNTTRLYFPAYSIPDITFDNISVKEIAGNHASQATAASRPVLQQDGNGKYYLGFDGVDDSLETAAVNFTATDKLSVFAGGLWNTGVTYRTLVNNGGNPGADTGRWAVVTPNADGIGRSLFMGTSSSPDRQGPLPAGLPFVLSTFFNMVAATPELGNTLRFNTVVQTSILGSTPGGGTFANSALSLGGSNVGSGRLSGRIYSLIARGALSTTQEITDTETWVAGKTGVTL